MVVVAAAGDEEIAEEEAGADTAGAGLGLAAAGAKKREDEVVVGLDAAGIGAALAAGAATARDLRTIQVRRMLGGKLAARKVARQ